MIASAVAFLGAGCAERGGALLAAVHAPPAITVPGALIGGAALGWLWWWQGRDGVPASRRRLRRISIVGMLILLPMLVAGASFVDPDLEPRRYAETWTVAVGLLAIVVLLAVVDAFNTFRLHAKEQLDASRTMAREMAELAARRLGDDPAEISRRMRAAAARTGAADGTEGGGAAVAPPAEAGGGGASDPPPEPRA
ncbi:MAG TPA: hypothetical protein PKC43_00735 [Phycisphaerales bacterium]|nr:hypothetical protein [Phycisphaerales bacterium]HMP35951.1 hypothetical protein [Phycisphaerales bacterium]